MKKILMITMLAALFYGCGNKAIKTVGADEFAEVTTQNGRRRRWCCRGRSRGSGGSAGTTGS